MATDDGVCPAILGFDFLIGQDGDVYFLEVNDHPAGLESLILGSGHSDVERSIALSGPLALVAAYAGVDPVIVVPPDRYRGLASVEDAVRAMQHQHNGSEAALVGLNFCLWFFETLVEAGFDVEFASTDRLREHHSTPGFLVRRGLSLPRYLYSVPSFNDIRYRVVCLDKMYRPLLKAASRFIKLPNTLGMTHPRLDLLKQAHKFLVIKPRFGAGSDGIRRVLSRDEIVLRDDSLVVQEWIEGAVVRQKGRPYRFDLRVFASTDGSHIATARRTAALPADSEYHDSPLSLLTTTGSLTLLKQDQLEQTDMAPFAKQIGEAVAVALEMARICQQLASEVSIDRSIALLRRLLGPVPT